MPRPVAIVSALPQELALLRAALEDASSVGMAAPIRAWRGQLDGTRVVLAEAGIGKVATAASPRSSSLTCVPGS
jgi:nucleoside phosphorylase